MALLKWDIYEVCSQNTSLNGIMLRGRLRKFALKKNENILVENSEDSENLIRFAVLSGQDITELKVYLSNILNNISINLVMKEISNPVLSKLKVNLEERYTL